MSVEDRASSILPRLLVEPELANGTIVLVGHSMGGIIIKEILRLAERLSATDQNISSFEKRVRKAVFIATPHQGSWMSTAAKRCALLFRPTAATTSLGRNDSHLRSLNAWFRDYATNNRLDILGFGETLRTFWGQVVHADSSDLGLASPAKFIPLDEDHFSISTPPTRTADIYVHLKAFIRLPPRAQHSGIVQLQKLETIDEGVRRLLRHAGGGIPRGPVNPIINSNAVERVMRLRRSRYFIGVNPIAEARSIADAVLEGDLLSASSAIKSNSLAWCARFLASDVPHEANRLLDEAKRLGTSDEVSIASAFISAALGNREHALVVLSAIDTDLGRTAAFLIATNGLSPSEAIAWMDNNGRRFQDLDGDGKFIAMTRMISIGQVDRALSSVQHISEADKEYSPHLHHSVAMSHLLAAVPSEVRDTLKEHTPFDWSQFPLREDSVSLDHLRKARESFAAAARAASDLGCEIAGQHAEDFALWLALRDPTEAAAAREQLVRSMADPRTMVRRVPMAIQFGLQLDRVAVNRTLSMIEATPGADGNDALLARFVLTLEDNDFRALTQFIAENRERLSDIVGAAGIAFFEIRALAQTDRLPEAQAKLTDLRASGSTTEVELQKLESILAEARGEDTISAVEERFRSSNSLDDLVSLVTRLQEREEWRRLAPYALELYGRMGDLRSASTYAHAAHESNEWPAVVSFLEGKTDFLQRSDNLRRVFAWSLYRLGHLTRAREALEPLLVAGGNANDRVLQINIAITSGDWGSLAPIVEHTWINRLDRTATDLLEAGQLGAIIGSPRARDLVREAVAKNPTDAGVLVAAYFAAVSGGWEDDSSVAMWLRTAMDASEGDEGPLRRMSLDDLMNLHPDWERRESEVWDQLTRGSIPLFVAAIRLNRTIISMLLTPALANLDESDPRKRSILLSFSGCVSSPAAAEAVQKLAASQTTIALEASSLLVLSFLDRLTTVIDTFQKILIPHVTMRWLLDERQKAQFHQPSQVRSSRELRDLLSQGNYFVVDASAPPKPNLVDNVGEELAILLEAARHRDEDDIQQKVVIRPGPVHRPTSLMKDSVDLSSFDDVLCGCGDVVEALFAQGQITDDEARAAKDYLNLHEVPWTKTPTITPEATLLLDDLAISNFQHLGLLGTLGVAGFRVGISRGHVERVNALIKYDAYANETTSHIEGIRSALANGIATGKVKLGSEVDDDEQLHRINQYPTADVLELAHLADIIIIDDRALNKFPGLDIDGKNVPIGCTLDLLALLERAGAISASERTEAETKLRRGGFQMMPVKQDDLVRLVNSAPILNGKVQETAHLKSIRENIERLRMTDALQLPLDQPWFSQLLTAVREAVRAQWNAQTDDATARARSDWLLGLLHLQGWSHRFDVANDRSMILNRYRMLCWIVLSISLVSTAEVGHRYAAWVEDTLIRAMQSHDPTSLEALIEQSKNYIEELAGELAEELDRRRDDAD